MKHFSVLRIVIIVVLAVVFVVAAGELVGIFLERKEATDTYEDLQSLVVLEKTKTPETDPAKTNGETLPPVEESELPDISVDFKTLQEKHPDVVAWIYSEGTEISYPVAQGKDNDQYLRHLLTGKYNVAGTIFADYRNGSIGTDDNYVIYGHNMKNGSMFGSMLHYKKQEYYDDHPVLWLFTPEAIYRVELLAGYVTSTTSSAYTLNFETDEALADYVTEAINKSTFQSEVAFEAGDRLVTFSTCSYEYKNARYVLVGKMVQQ